MELILHYGTLKTGSTSIQDTLYNHLDDPDVSYIAFHIPNTSLWITQGFSDDWHKRPQYAREQLTQEQIESRTQKSREALVEKIHSTTTRKGILSAESISHLKPSEIHSLIRFLRPHVSSIRAIGYFRSPKSYVESVFQERLKHIPTKFSERLIRIRYRKLIESLDVSLGEENVEVYKFDRRTLKDGCVVKDFCSHAGINIKDEHISISNESLSRPAVQLLYLLWKYYPEFYHPHTSWLHRLTTKLFSKNGEKNTRAKIIATAVDKASQFSGEKMFFHSDAYRKIVNIDDGELEWLEKRTGIAFDEDLCAHDADGFKTEEELMRPDETTIQLLLEKLELNPNKAPHLMKDPRLLAKHIYMLVHRN